MKNKHLLPFGWAPAHWGLSGKTREVAKAEYNLEGEELDRELLRINLAGRTDKEIAKMKLLLDVKYSHISDEEYDRENLKLLKDDLPEKEYKLLALELDKEYDTITDDEYDKQKATILEEPFVRVTRISTDPNNPASGSVALDYNKAFVVYLEEHGYGPAPNEEEIVDKWFTELCRNIALDTFDGIGNFNETLDETTARNQDVIYKKDLKKKDDK